MCLAPVSVEIDGFFGPASVGVHFVGSDDVVWGFIWLGLLVGNERFAGWGWAFVGDEGFVGAVVGVAVAGGVLPWSGRPCVVFCSLGCFSIGGLATGGLV